VIAGASLLFLWLIGQAVCVALLGWLVLANLPERCRRELLDTDLEWPLALCVGIVAVACLQLATFLLGHPTALGNGLALTLTLGILAVRPLRAHLPVPGLSGKGFLLFGLYLIYLLLLLAVTPSYATGRTADWFLYWPNVGVYLRAVPLKYYQTPGALEYLVKRTPLLSLYGAFWVSLSSINYSSFQLACLVPNAMPFLAIWVWTGRRGLPGTRKVAAVLLALAPAAARLDTVPEPKALAAALVLLALLEQVRPNVAGTPWRGALAGFLSVAAVMTHPSAIFYVIWPYAFGLWRTVRKRVPLDHGLWIGTIASAVVIVLPWVVWAVAALGGNAVFHPNRTVLGEGAFSLPAYVSAQIGMAATTVFVPIGMFRDAAAAAGGWLPAQLSWSALSAWINAFANPILRTYDQTFLAGSTLTVALTATATALWLRRKHFCRVEPCSNRVVLWTSLVVGALACLAANVAIVDFKGQATNQLAPLFLAVLATEASILATLPRWWIAVTFVFAGVEFLATQTLVLVIFELLGWSRLEHPNIYDWFDVGAFDLRVLVVTIFFVIWSGLYAWSLRRSDVNALRGS
jgi:hypothetical protein